MPGNDKTADVTSMLAKMLIEGGLSVWLYFFQTKVSFTPQNAILEMDHIVSKDRSHVLSSEQ